MRVAVIGGGLAGLAAAVVLAEAGYRVVVHERRPVLGGRASSSPTGEGEESVDNCQHVMMRCCTALWRFYGLLGVQEKIRFSDHLTFLDREGRTSVLSGSSLPAPLHLAPSFLRFGPLTAVEKLAVARTLGVILTGRGGKGVAEEPIGPWLRRHGQSERAMAHFWQPVIVSALNEEPDRTAAHYAFHLFREGFLNNPKAFEVGVPTVPLAELYQEPAPRFLAARGGEVRLRSRVERVRLRDDGSADGVVLGDGVEEPADYVVAAVPWHALPLLLPAEVVDREPYFADLKRLEGSPITAVHLWFDRPLAVPEHCVLLDRTVQWVFDKSRPGGDAYLGLVVSASREWLPKSRAEILAAAQRDLEEALPQVRAARVVRAAVIKEPHATFSPAPGAEWCRPGTVSPIPRLLVAGDWTRTGWPATMESAVRSGFTAAEAILASEGVSNLTQQAMGNRAAPYSA
jgi:squalene-associated FAD-dependent desaturase